MQVCDFDESELTPGESHLTDNCSETVCGTNFEVTTYTCGIEVRDGCELEPDFSLKYPGQYQF